MSNRSKCGSKTASVILAILLVLVLAAGVVGIGYMSDWFSDWSKFESEETPEDENEDAVYNGGLVVGENEESGITLLSSAISPANYDEYGVSTYADSAYSIKVTVTPSDATDQSVSLSLAWVNASSSWASGKSVSNYVTLSSNSVNSGSSFTVTCTQAFGEQIRLTATANGSSTGTLSANVTFDYAYRYSGISGLIFGTLDDTDWSGNLSLESENMILSNGNLGLSLVTSTTDSRWDEDTSFEDVVMRPTVSSAGTIYEDITNIEVNITSTISYFSGPGFKWFGSRSGEVSEQGVYYFSGSFIYWADFYDQIFDTQFYNSTVSSSEASDFYKALSAVDGLACEMTITFEGVETGTQYSYTLPMKLSGYSSLYTYVTGISLSPSGSHIF